METREEIEKDLNYYWGKECADLATAHKLKMIVKLLLDIRELSIKTPPEEK